jgi:endothelin-converting enzyme/putative endopeptidase
MRSLAAAALVALAPCAFAADAPVRKGIETGDLDRTVAPCTDFYEFANGAWRAANPIPPSMVRWSRRWAAGETAKDQLNAILDGLSARTDWPKGSVEQLVADHYGSCMDEARVEALGLEPIKPRLAEIEALADIAGVQKMIGRFHELAIPVPFGLTASSDNHQPTQVIADVYASGLGLPDRDYYVKTEPRFQEAREKYKVHVAHLIELGEDRAGRAGRRKRSSRWRSSSPSPRSATSPGATRRPPTTRRASWTSRTSPRTSTGPATSSRPGSLAPPSTSSSRSS